MPPVIIQAYNPDDENLFQRAAACLSGGGLIAFPTDTFYALGADPYNSGAIEALYRLKGRPPGKPVLLLIADSSQAVKLWGRIDRRCRILMDRFWPGPLTIVGPRGPEAPDLPGRGGIALRVPGNQLTLNLLRYLNRPLTGTSANPCKEPPPRSAMEVAAYFGNCQKFLSLVIDGGTYSGEKVSTIIEIGDTGMSLLREGAVPMASLLAALEETGENQNE